MTSGEAGRLAILMEARDRFRNLGVFGAALLAWITVGFIVTGTDPILDPAAGFIGAVCMGVAVGLTAVPIFWLAIFSRHGRIAFRGDWPRAIRRGGWAGIVVGLFVALRLQGALQLPIALFVLAMVAIAEATLSVER
jgi:hypothetical protein